MKKPNILVFSGYGLNCEEETKFAFEKAGGAADIVHINDLIEGLVSIGNYQILAFPGGFAYGDDTGSGNAYANKLKNHLWKDIVKFISQGGLIIGICNGFQILVNLGLLPALNKKYGERQVALLHNSSARYIDRWVDLKVENKSPWLVGINKLSAPISHGEGRLYVSEEVLKQLKEKSLIALRYFKGEVCNYQNLESNPNGSIDNIAGLSDETGRILGLMPHPDRALFFTQLPNWPLLKEKLKREQKPLFPEGQGLQIFKNGVNYFANIKEGLSKNEIFSSLPVTNSH
ncbi:phosphoribosylformylglycinamidine synthase I [Candidatus Daviesbacteria bacterium]|nr:phosphoribosylformylglycinamidine synthase I [Candidatus Daviesbacteria bacterium]